MITNDEIEELYMPWHNHKQTCKQLSSGVNYVGYFKGFGPMIPLQNIWRWNKNGLTRAQRGRELYINQSFQERALDATLADMKNCVVLSTTASYYSQFQSACLLKSRGFQLLQDRCYKHPGYSDKVLNSIEHPGVPDRCLHWEHIWWKVIGRPTKIGNKLPNGSGLNNCGVDVVIGLDDLQVHDEGERKNFLAVAWLPRETPWPKGWTGFFSAEDYKLGVNFDLIGGIFKSKVQTCPHNFDLKILEGWEPDFDRWTPA